MATLKQSCRVFSVPQFSSSSLPFLLVLSLVLLTSMSAFQFQTISSCHTYRTISSSAFAYNDSTTTTDFLCSDEAKTSNPDIDAIPAISESASFGESVAFVPLTRRDQKVTSNEDPGPLFSTRSDEVKVDEIKENRMRNIAVAITSFTFACLSYGWQFTHPVTAVEILASMEKSSAPLTAIGNNGKPTVIDFWAPWCENCRVAAPTLQAVEEEYGERVNFIMVNADDGDWPLISLFGVDSIPHLALISGEGDVETALIGPMSRNVLRADLDALLNKHDDCKAGCHDDLPYKMFDAFSDRQESRQINFAGR